MARSAKIIIDADTATARASMESLEEGLEDAEVQARRTDRQIENVGSGLGTAAIVGQLAGIRQQLRSTGRAADDASGEVGEFGAKSSATRVSIGALSTSSAVLNAKVLTLAGTFTTAGTALGALTTAMAAAEAGGVALSAKFGPQGVQQDFKNLKSEARATAQALGSEFASSAQSVGSAISGLLDLVRSSTGVIEAFAQDFELLLETQAQLGGPISSALLGIFRGLEERGEEAATSLEGARSELVRFDRKRRAILDRAEVARSIGLPEQQVLKQKKKGLEDIRKELIKFAARLDGQARETVTRALEAYQRAIRDTKKEMEALQNPLQSIIQRRGLPSAMTREPAVVRQSAADVGVRSLGPPGSMTQSQLETSVRQGSARQMRRMLQTAKQLEKVQRRVKEQMQDGKSQAQQTDNEIQAMVQSAGALGSALVRAFRRGKLEATEMAALLLQQFGAVATAAGNPIAGAALSSGGQIIGSFEEGGTMPRTGLAKLHPPEVVTGLPGGAEVIARDETIKMMQQSATQPRQQTVKVELAGGEIQSDLFKLEARLREVESFKDSFMRSEA